MWTRIKLSFYVCFPFPEDANYIIFGRLDGGLFSFTLRYLNTKMVNTELGHFLI